MPNRNILTIGVTGPTGSGKSTVISCLCEMGGFSVIDTDRLAREVTAPDSPVLGMLAQEFGQDIVREDGSLDRRELARRAFATAATAARLNAITHPAIVARAERQRQQLAAQGETTVLVDAPLLYEAGMDAVCDGVIAVLARPEVRLARIMERDSISEQDARTRMSAGKPDMFYIDRGAYVFRNDGQPLEPRMVRVLEQIEGWRRGR